jgi:hypothetical protein
LEFSSLGAAPRRPPVDDDGDGALYRFGLFFLFFFELTTLVFGKRARANYNACNPSVSAIFISGGLLVLLDILGDEIL